AAATTCATPLPTLTTSYGDTIFRYQLPQGVISVPAPSATFDAATAPSARLRALGLPTESTTSNAAASATNVRQLAAIRKGITHAPAAPCVHHGRKNTPVRNSASTVNSTSANWSGYVQQ